MSASSNDPQHIDADQILLSIRDLSVHYLTPTEEVTAVSNVSLEVKRGETLGLVGESGSGKSTLIGAVLRTLGPPSLITSGEARFQEVDLLCADEAEMRALRWVQLSLVPQSAMNALNPVMTVRDQIEDALRARWGLDATPQRLSQRCVELMELVSIDPERLQSYPHQLSGGMRQRVSIALSLAFEPLLVVMDEPTTALDVIVQAEILEMIQDLSQQLGFSILMITHDLPLMLSFADRVGVMLQGELVELNTPSELIKSPRHHYTRELIEASRRSHSSSQSKLDEPALSSPSPLPSSLELTPILSVKGLSVSYTLKTGLWSRDELRAVQRVDLELHRGETLAVVGASGSGKSTLGRALCLLERPKQGEMTLFGEAVDLLKPPRDFRRHVQMIFQDPFGSLNPVHTIAHHLIRPLKIHHKLQDQELRSRAEELLESVGLSPASMMLDRYPYQLSGGQRQRVAIARGLAPEPSVLIADEPTSMLDVSIRGELLSLLRDLVRERNMSLVLITHDLDTARALADRILVLKSGEVVEEGPADVMLNAPQSTYTQALWAAQPNPIDLPINSPSPTHH